MRSAPCRCPHCGEALPESLVRAARPARELQPGDEVAFYSEPQNRLRTGFYLGPSEYVAMVAIRVEKRKPYDTDRLVVDPRKLLLVTREGAEMAEDPGDQPSQKRRTRVSRPVELQGELGL